MTQSDPLHQTTNLVSRLRELADRQVGRSFWPDTTLREAADEIENLRIRVARLEGYSDGLAERVRQVRRAVGCDHE